jgi:hypothetical protein
MLSGPIDAQGGRGEEGDTSYTPSKDLEKIGHLNAIIMKIEYPP